MSKKKELKKRLRKDLQSVLRAEIRQHDKLSYTAGHLSGQRCILQQTLRLIDEIYAKPVADDEIRVGDRVLLRPSGVVGKVAATYSGSGWPYGVRLPNGGVYGYKRDELEKL